MSSMKRWRDFASKAARFCGFYLDYFRESKRREDRGEYKANLIRCFMYAVLTGVPRKDDDEQVSRLAGG